MASYNPKELQYLLWQSQYEQVRRKIMPRHIDFTRYMYSTVHKKAFNKSKFQELIGAALDRVLSGKCKRLIINMPPRYGKTEIAVKNFIAKGLALNPSAKFIHLSYSDMLALDNSEAARAIVGSEEYMNLYPKVKIKPDSDSKKKWYTTEGGGVYATSTRGQVTGFGAGNVDIDYSTEPDEIDKLINEALRGGRVADADNLINKIIGDEVDGLINYLTNADIFGGAILIDDPIKPEDADSEIVRERVNQRFDSTIRNRTNSRNTPIIIIMQRLHPNDLCGYLMKQEPGEWEVLSLPAIYVEEGIEYALDPHRHTLAELKAMREKNSVVFDRQYMQNAKPSEGLLFPEEQLHYFFPSDLDGRAPEFTFMPVDPADTGGDNLAAPYCELYDNRVYITDVVFNKDGTDVNEPRLVNIITSRKTNAVNIEGVSGWSNFGKHIRTKALEKHNDCEIRITKETRNKQTRILAGASWIRNNCYFLAEKYWTAEYRLFMMNLVSYMKVGENKHDDAPDSLTMVANYFEKNFSHLW